MADQNMTRLHTCEVNMLAATNGPQIGVYSFDYATQSWPAELLMAQESDR